MITISLDGVAKVQEKLLQLRPQPNAIKRRVVKKIAKKALALSKQHVKAESDLEDRAWQRRKSGARKKMLVKLGRTLKIVKATDDEAILGWPNTLAGVIAWKHQYGFVETFTPAQFGKSKNKLTTKDPATRQQAKALIEAGYKRKRDNGRSFQTPTLKWITENMNIGRAGIILRALRGGAKQEWEIELPPRSFLGVTDAELVELTDLAIKETLAELAS